MNGDDGPPSGRLTVFVGNDTTQSAVGGLLNLDWHQHRRHAARRRPSRSAWFNVPLREGPSPPGCEYQHGRLCRLARFVSIVRGSIQVSATGPISYQGRDVGSAFPNGRRAGMRRPADGLKTGRTVPSMTQRQDMNSSGLRFRSGR